MDGGYLDPESGMVTGITLGTRQDYARMAERSFLERLGDLPVTMIDTLAVKSWVNWQGEQTSAQYPDRPIAAKTIKNYHALLSGALQVSTEALSWD